MHDHFTEDRSAEIVNERADAMVNPRLAAVMASLVRHLHAFVREVTLIEEEWGVAIDFLTRTGQVCSETRQEFILLSDVLGVSMLVDAVNNRKPAGATETTVFGPFHVAGAPERPVGRRSASTARASSVCSRAVCSTLREPDRERACRRLVRQCRGLLRRAAARHPAEVEQPRPLPYGAGRPLRVPRHQAGRLSDPRRRPGRRDAGGARPPPYRPAHTHFLLTAPGCERLVTHLLFVGGDDYLASDSVFGVKQGLIADFEPVEDGSADLWRGRFDVVLTRAPAAPSA